MNEQINDEDKLAKKADDDAIIAECMDRMRISLAADGKNREAQLDDLAFLAGDQWDPMIKAQRAMERRPCLTINKLPTTLHQVTNSQRQNVPSIKISPIGDTDKKKAEIIQGGIRAIEYKSNASTAYDTAVNSAAAIGRGYFRLVTQYCSPSSFDQEIAFQRIRNSFTVYMDPGVVNVDASDQKWCIISVKMKRVDFRLEFPQADAVDFEGIRGLGDRVNDWADNDEVRVAEYYRIYREKATAILLSNGETGWKDKLIEMPEGVYVKAERPSYRETVQWFKLSATEILERADIPCKWIPVFQVLGDEIDIDGKVDIRGLIRNAKDPARMYNYWMTAATEQVGLIPKAPYIGAEGQFEGHETKWSQANQRSFPYLEYKPKTLGGNLAPPPQRQHMPDVPTGVLAMAQHASEDIKSTTGIFDASLGAKSNETSGIAIARRDKQGETSTFHYTDNLNTTLAHAGRCIINMWPKVYDGERTLEMMGADGKMSSAVINQAQRTIDPKTQQAVDEILNDMTDGQYGVVVSSGPSYDTLRQEAVDGMVAVGQAWPKLMEIAGDKVVRSMDWPMADEIADRIEKTIPPELRKEEGDQEDMVDTPMGPVPKEQVGSILAQMQQQMQQMEAMLQEAQSGVDKAKISAEASIEVAKINAESKADTEELKGMIAIILQKLQPPPELASEVSSDMGKDGNNTGASQPSE